MWGVVWGCGERLGDLGSMWGCGECFGDVESVLGTWLSVLGIWEVFWRCVECCRMQGSVLGMWRVLWGSGRCCFGNLGGVVGKG